MTSKALLVGLAVLLAVGALAADSHPVGVYPVPRVAGPLKLVLFFDAGNAWLEGQSFNPLEMRMSTGAELRMFLPIFQAPLRFIYGVNLDPKVIKGQNGVPMLMEKSSDFQFSIGTTF